MTSKNSNAILIVVGGFLSSNLKEEQFEVISASIQSQLVHIDFAVTNFFIDIKKDLKNIVTKPLVMTREDQDFTNFLNADEGKFQYHIGEREQQIINFLNNYRINHEYVNSAYMGRSNGSFVRSHKRNRPTRYDPRQKPWYTLGWNNPGKVMMTKPYMSATTPDINIGIVTALVDEKNKN